MQCNMQNNVEEIILSVISGSPLVDDQYSTDCYSAVVFEVKEVNLFIQFQLLFKRSVQCTLRDLVIIIIVAKIKYLF